MTRPGDVGPGRAGQAWSRWARRVMAGFGGRGKVWAGRVRGVGASHGRRGVVGSGVVWCVGAWRERHGRAWNVTVRLRRDKARLGRLRWASRCSSRLGTVSHGEADAAWAGQGLTWWGGVGQCRHGITRRVMARRGRAEQDKTRQARHGAGGGGTIRRGEAGAARSGDAWWRESASGQAGYVTRQVRAACGVAGQARLGVSGLGRACPR